MLSLVLGPEITDASVAAISSSYADLELLDLSGSWATKSGAVLYLGGYSCSFTNKMKLMNLYEPIMTSSYVLVAFNLQQPNCLFWNSWTVG
ncbi:hypothetical protein HHK36_003385 [Tetracentron sinense]|uniref:Uncharacterized protein n=1 Tax=Tetracentron sinense TaxID=13715 RepID=A0A835DNL3_TETSI|nr:hypothetical protein HHK36_003385 [Tetracentron sinense]